MLDTHDGEWTVWGDGAKPVLQDTEAECRAYVENHADDLSLYLAGPDGSEYEFYNGSWRKS